jgi:hypothetical protein
VCRLATAILTNSAQVARPAQHLHQPDQTATGFGWEKYLICGLAGYAGRWAATLRNNLKKQTRENVNV